MRANTGLFSRIRSRVARWVAPEQVKRAPYRWPLYLAERPQQTLDNFSSYVREGFDRNALIYSAIMYKARASTLAPLQACIGDPDNPDPLPETHPLSMLASRPNPFQGAAEFQSLNVAYLNLAGHAYIMLARDNYVGEVRAMYPLRPDRVAIVPDNVGGVMIYVYVPEGVSATDTERILPILPEDMLHIRLPNPADRFEGQGPGRSPIQAAASSGDVDNMVTDFLNLFFRKGAMFNGALTTDDPIDDTTAAEIRDRFMAIFGGFENWAEVAVFGNGLNYQRIGLTFEEMGFEAIDKRNAGRVLMVFGVPGALLSEPTAMERSTFSNIEELRRVFWEDTFAPELRLFESEYSFRLRSADGGYIKFDMSAVPALQRDIPALVEAATRMIGTGTPPAVAYATVGLDVPEYEGSNTSWMPLSMLPVGTAPVRSTATTGETPEQLMDGQEEAKLLTSPFDVKAPRRLSDARARRLHETVDAIALLWEGPFADAAERAFENDRRRLLAILKREKAAARARKGITQFMNVWQGWDEYFQEDAGENWRREFIPVIQGVIEDQGTEWNSAFGIEFDVRNLFAEQWFEDYTLIFAQSINETSSDAMSTMLQQGMSEGWSIPAMEQHLDTMFRQWMVGDQTSDDFAWYEERMPLHRRELIARTETVRASNAGSLELFRGWKAPKKAWLATSDGRTRDSHLAAYAKYGPNGNPGPIPIDTPFMVNGYAMMYPGDPNAPIGESANCRCSLMPAGMEDRWAVEQAEPGRLSPRGDRPTQASATTENVEGMRRAAEEWFARNQAYSVDNNGMPVFSDPVLAAQKDEISRMLSEHTGIDYEICNRFIRQWSRTSNDEDFRSLSIQAMAAELFETELSDWQREKYIERLTRRAETLEELEVAFEQYRSVQAERERILAEIESSLPSVDNDDWNTMEEMFELVRAREDAIQAALAERGIELPPLPMVGTLRASDSYVVEQITFEDVDLPRLESGVPYDSPEEATTALLRAMHDITQRSLRDGGVETLVLYRGVSFTPDQAEGIIGAGVGATIDFDGNALESWSLRPEVATLFADRYRRSGTVGVVLQIEVPVSRAVATARTGFGCLNEWEVVLHSAVGDQARVMELYE